jgi:hypothetical protein
MKRPRDNWGDAAAACVWGGWVEAAMATLTGKGAAWGDET